MVALPEIHPKTRTIVFTLVAGILLLIVTGLSFVVEKESQSIDAGVSHSYDVDRALDRALLLLLEAESAERGFLLTDEPTFLRPDVSYTDLFAVATARLEGLVSDNPVQKARARTLRDRGIGRLRLLDAIIEDRKRGSLSSYGLPLRARMVPGKGLTDQVRGLIADMTSEEDRVLGRQLATNARVDRIATAVILADTGLL